MFQELVSRSSRKIFMMQYFASSLMFFSSMQKDELFVYLNYTFSWVLLIWCKTFLRINAVIQKLEAAHLRNIPKPAVEKIYCDLNQMLWKK